MAFIKRILTTSGTGTTSPNVTVATQGSTNKLIMFVSTGSSTTLTSVADSQGNTWAVDVATTTGGRNVAIASSSSTHALSTSDTFTITISGAGAFSAACYEYDAVLGFDKSSSAVGSAITTLATGSTATLAQAEELVVTTAGVGSNVTFTTPGGFTNRVSGQLTGALADLAVNSTAAQSATWSWSVSANAAVAIATYRTPVTLTINKSETTTVTDNVANGASQPLGTLLQQPLATGSTANVTTFASPQFVNTPTVGNTDILVAVSSSTVSTPAGYSLDESNTGNAGIYIFRRTVAAGDTGAAVTLTVGVSRPIAIGRYEFVGTAAIDNGGAAHSNKFFNSTTTTARSGTAITTTSPNSLFVFSTDNVASNQTWSSWSNSIAQIAAFVPSGGTQPLNGIVGYVVSGSIAVGSVTVSATSTQSSTKYQVLVVAYDYSANVTVSDSSTVTDAPVVSIAATGTDLNITVNDPSTVTDPAILEVDAYPIVSENSTVTDSPLLSITSFINVNDTSTITDSVFLTLVSLVSVSDTSTVTDNTPTPGLALPVVVSDPSTVIDSVAALLPFLVVNVTDASTVTDSPTVSIAGVTGDQINVNDTVTVADVPIELIPTLSLTVNDASAVTDVPLETLVSFMSTSDASTVTENNVESITGAGSSLNINVNDTIGAYRLIMLISTGKLAIELSGMIYLPL